MRDALSEIDETVTANKLLCRKIARGTSRLIRSREELSLIKATSFAWFRNHRPIISSALDEAKLRVPDDHFKKGLMLAEKSSTRHSYMTLLKKLGFSLLAVQAELLTSVGTRLSFQLDEPPDFKPLISDSKMQGILVRRWHETQKCIRGEAPLAAIVMMGGLLEAILLSRLNAMPDKSVAFKTKSTPRDGTTNKTLPLRDWTLRNYLDVAHELGWICQSAKDVGVVLRDYRNYIHPAKEYSHGIVITPGDTSVMWPVFVSITQQLIASVLKTKSPGIS
jgi:hypothetical protein